MTQQQTKTPSKTLKLKKQAGLTLVEVVSSLTIVGLVVGGALAMFGSASSTQKANQMTADVAALGTGIKSLYYSQGSYGSALLATTLVTAGKVPSTLIVTDTSGVKTLTHSMGGSVIPTGVGNTFTIAVGSIPKEVCVNMLTAELTNTTVSTSDAATNASGAPLPVPPATAVTNCTPATGKTSVTVTYTMS
jgi:type II secretory pathway pseudopilin PulG